MLQTRILKTKMLQTELAIIGAGPAGLAAAEVAIDCGLDVTVVDEQRTPGGQIYRQPPPEFKVSNWLSGRAYRKGKELLRRLSENRKAHWLMQSTVCGIMDANTTGAGGRFTLLVNGKPGTRQLMADAVLMAPGCYDLPAIFPGWNFPVSWRPVASRPSSRASNSFRASGSCSLAVIHCNWSWPTRSSRPVVK